AVDRKLKLEGVHQLPDTCMASPAIADGMLLFRTRGHVVAIGEGGHAEGMKVSSQTLAAKEPPAVSYAKPKAALAGTWAGTLKVGEVNLRLRFDIKDDGASMKGVITSIDQGNVSAPLSGVGQHDDVVRLDMEALAAAFEGHWNEEKAEITGE